MQTARININPDLRLRRTGGEQIGYSVAEIAKKVNGTASRWQDWESGNVKPTANQLIRLSSQLERSPAFFIYNKYQTKKLFRI